MPIVKTFTVRLSRELVQLPKLRGNPKMLLSILHDMKRGKSVTTNLGAICDVMGISYRNVEKGLEKLKKNNLLWDLQKAPEVIATLAPMGHRSFCYDVPVSLCRRENLMAESMFGFSGFWAQLGGKPGTLDVEHSDLGSRLGRSSSKSNCGVRTLDMLAEWGLVSFVRLRKGWSSVTVYDPEAVYKKFGPKKPQVLVAR